ncbi:LEA type 2 family protein [Brachyspira pulli]|uniref:LEA type 2 family protein n=1 Tax=Brachyspira pulli TaxID=310721 RepID=UPI0030073DC0
MLKKIAILSSLLITILFITSCETLQSSAVEITRGYIEEHKPDIKIKKANISEITLKDMTLTTLLEVKNNLPFEVPIEKIQIDLINTSGKTFATASSVETLKIPANQAREVNIDFNAKYLDVFTTAFGAIKDKSFKCTSKTTLTFTVYGMNFSFPYEKEITFVE